MAAWFPPAALAILIFIASSITIKTPLPAPGCSDKAIHAGIYGLLAYFFARALSITRKEMSGRMLSLLSFSFAFFYGISDEIHQMFVPGRTPDLVDLLFDGIGGGIGVILFFSVSGRRKEKERP